MSNGTLQFQRLFKSFHSCLEMLDNKYQDKEKVKRKLKTSIQGEHVDEEIIRENLFSKDDNFLKDLYKFLKMNRNDIKTYSIVTIAKIEAYLVKHELKGIIKQLVGKGMSFNTLNVDGHTALHEAVVDRPADFIVFLLDLGLDFRALDAKRRNCCFRAIEEWRTDLMSLFIERGIRAEAPSNTIFQLLKDKMIANDMEKFKRILRTGLNDLKEYRDVDDSNLALLVS